MSVRIFIRDNSDGKVHEYGTNHHDSLFMQEDGSIHYQNLQNGDGTLGGGYAFCTVSGKNPEDCEGERLIDIGGDRTGAGCHKCRWKTRPQKCSCCRRNPNQKDCFELDKKTVDALRKAVSNEKSIHEKPRQ